MTIFVAQLSVKLLCASDYGIIINLPIVTGFFLSLSSRVVFVFFPLSFSVKTV